MNGVLRNEDINYNNCCINNINGISFDENSRLPLINRSLLSRQHYPKLKGVIPHTIYFNSSYVTSSNKGFNNKWKRYISDVNKSQKGGSIRPSSSKNSTPYLMRADTSQSQSSHRSPEL